MSISLISNPHQSIQTKQQFNSVLKLISLTVLIISFVYQGVNYIGLNIIKGGNTKDGENYLLNGDTCNNDANSTIVRNSSSYTVTEYRGKDDNFSDLVAIVFAERDENNPEPFESVVIREEIYEDNPTLSEQIADGYIPNENDTILEHFQLSIRKQELYQETDEIIPKLLDYLATMPIKNVSQIGGGTQLKLWLIFEDDSKAMFKPMTCSRDYQTSPNHFWFHDLERHTAEIATFHLDRILGYRRTAPAVGRVLNMTSEIEKICEDQILLENFFTSPAGNRCVYGSCKQLCDIEHAVCGNGDLLEGSVIAMLPFYSFDRVGEKHWQNPWKRMYDVRLKANWTKNEKYCYEQVMKDPIYQSGRRLLDVIDMAILDFLIGNQDRHHYETFKAFGNESSIIHLDHGRAFGRAFFDDLIILTPIRQCCQIRESTMKRLLEFQIGPKHLSQIMRESLASDPIAPVLWEPHFAALDRRVSLILQTVRDCVNKSHG